MIGISYKIGRRKVCVYIGTVLAKGIKGGFRLGTVHGLGGDDLILVAVSRF